jgi:hypothetical protein
VAFCVPVLDGSVGSARPFNSVTLTDVRVADVREIVSAAKVDPSYYSLDEIDRSGALHLLAFGQMWRVFVSERGERFEEKEFASEDAACIYFLKRLFYLWSPR